VKIKITPEGVLVETVDEGDDLLFDVSSAKLGQPLQRFLKAFAPMLVKLGRPVEINGHTDARAFAKGSKLNNWDLSYQRAAAAREIFEHNGVPKTQIVGLFARGSSQLFDPTNPLAPQNRRLSFLLRITGSHDKVQKVDELADSNSASKPMIDMTSPAPSDPAPVKDAAGMRDAQAPAKTAPKADAIAPTTKPESNTPHR
jgi:chemotaxis protein MotB